MAAFTNQETRLLTLATPLGDDVLLLTAFSGQETMSRLFVYQLEMISEEEDIKPQDIVGKNVTWGVQQVDKETRWFNGHVSRFSATGTRMHDRRTYRMEVVPYFWFLTRTSNCRIFQKKQSPDIIKQVFGDYGLTDVEFALKRTYSEWEYCVQYRETAYNFVARLMEHEGIFYFFKHDNGKHTLVVADHKGAYKDVVESPVDYLAGTLSPNHIDSWEHRYEFRSGKMTHTDYYFETPSTNLLANTSTIIKIPGVDKFEMFDYPGEYRVKPDGVDDVKVRMEEEEANYDVVSSSSGCPTFAPGHKFTLSSHEVEAEVGKSYLITSINHSAVDTSHDHSSQAAEYHNTFTSIPAEVSFRPQRLTPKPTVQGLQPALVVGPAGEEIFTDKYGRIKVQFYWDREGKKDENSSIWMRIAQDWAGKGWGMISIPRIGQEVMVDFLEGDPDQPIVVGRVYNAEVMPPFALPGQKMVSGWKSNTYPGGGGYNEMSFDDSKGKEKINVHGQYDMVTTVLHDDTQTIKNDRTITVDGKHTETIDKDTSITIKTGNFTHEVKTGTAYYYVKSAVEEKFDATMKATVKGAVQEAYQDSLDTIVKNGIHIASETAHIYIHTATSIQLHVGDSSIWMDSGGQIAIKGMNVTIDGKESVTITGGRVTSAAKTTHEIQGTNVKSDATGNNVVKGAMVMLNPGG